MKKKSICMAVILALFAAGWIMAFPPRARAANASDYTVQPPFVTNTVTPLVMLVMGRDHKLYFEAYNDASDLDGDGTLDLRYNPSIDYYGYFDSYKYYEYDSSDERFEPVGYCSDGKKAPSGSYWSGDFLNYLTMSRMDTLRKVLYGGYRSTDTATETVLERAYVTDDAHCWGKEYKDEATDGYKISDYTPYSEPTGSNRHLFATGSLVAPTDANYAPLLRVKLNTTYRIWDWVTIESGSHGDDALMNSWIGVDADFEVRVLVGVSSLPDLKSEKLYTHSSTSATVYKPIGLLQRYGESDRMYFGLMSGSYENHLSGGVLRKNISSITDEINADTGEFIYKDNSSIDGIIKTIDTFRLIGFNHTSNKWEDDRYNKLEEGDNEVWGNPIGEIMYETLRYFAGESATSAFTSGISDGDDYGLDLPLKAWQDPFSTYSYCSKPFMLVLSDIVPSFDTDQLPGHDSNFSHPVDGTFTGSLGSLNVKTGANTISAEEGFSGASSHYIGQSGAGYDTACSPKTVTGFGDIRGLCPEEPTFEGGYYSAAVAHYGRKTDISSATGDQKVLTYTVGLSSPLPRIEIPMDGDKTITMVPFAKTVQSENESVKPVRGLFQPTCAIVDFYVESLTSTYGKFRVNYEHAEHGSDFDMDALITYEYTVVSGTEISVTISSMEAIHGGSSRQHFGYIVSGTTADGTYLEIKNKTQSDAGDYDYYLDTPGTCGPNTGVSDTCWDDDTNLPNIRTRNFNVGTGTAATLINNPLYYAAKWGGYEEVEGGGSEDDIPNQTEEWDKDADGTPDTYFYVTNPLYLENQLNRSFADILRRTSSGTAASVISNSRTGEGAVYQSVFYPEYRGPLGNTINWAGQVHALLVDSYGNMREDTDGDAVLDMVDDYVIVFDETLVKKYKDKDGDGSIEATDDVSTDESVPVATGPFNTINFLWNSSEWLNEISDTNVIEQRSSYGTVSQQRYILTFVDADADMVADSGETLPFVWPTSDPSSLTDTATIYPYIQPFAPFNRPASLNTTFGVPTARDDYLMIQTERIIDYVRGKDQAAYSSTAHGTADYDILAFRSRQVDYDEDGTVETWRLGDIVYSTPTVVSRPAEGYHLLYRDKSYAAFANQYKNRRHVVYVGGNDGMLHAFNAGFYNNAYSRFDLTDPTSTAAAHALGAELWAYVPYNLLPHLLWLTEVGYDHVYYVDLKPRIFDAQIFFQSDGTTPLDADHPYGWGTVLVAGMRFGGGTIQADLDKTDGTSSVSSDRTMNSAYIVMDITNPEEPPRVLAELVMPDQGLTTSYPTALPMKGVGGISDPSTDASGDWWLVFGSGPHTSTSATSFDRDALDKAMSSLEKPKLYMVDLKELAVNGHVRTLKSDGSVNDPSGSDPWEPTTYQEFSSDRAGFVSDPIAVDYDLDFYTDAIYFGTVTGEIPAGTGTGWSGKLRRVVIDDQTAPTSWDGDSVLLALEDMSGGTHQPITAAPSIGLERNGQRWVYFGTGRFFTRNDADEDDQQTYYGVKEPWNSSSNAWSWGEVAESSLFDSTDITIHTGGTIKSGGSDTGWNWAQLIMNMNSYDGWKLDFTPANNKERNLGQSVLLGQLLTFTTYQPSVDTCTFEGTSSLYGAYYKTGTAYYKSVFGIEGEYDGIDNDGDGTIDEDGEETGTDDKILRKRDLGKGMAVTPNVHIGRETGSKAFIQTSTGAIVTLDQANPGRTKSGVTSWRDLEFE